MVIIRTEAGVCVLSSVWLQTNERNLKLNFTGRANSVAYDMVTGQTEAENRYELLT